jgi:hypothetical protein
MKRYIPALFGLFFISCKQSSRTRSVHLSPSQVADFQKTINDIPVPPGYNRLTAAKGSFGAWLRKLPLKKNKTVYLYNGTIKPNQAAQFAVLDVSTGQKDLQQCADVVMRLRAEYLFAVKKFDSICFTDYNGKRYQWTGNGDAKKFKVYLEKVFGWCGSASLEKQLKPVPDLDSIEAGDVLIRGGFPGHAVLVADMAIDQKGKKIYLIVQGYQPAQDMHVLINPLDKLLSPWYEVTDAEKIITPEWKFYRNELKRW